MSQPKLGTEGPPTTGEDEEPFERALRLVLGALGIAILTSGVVAAFLNKEGVAIAALLAAGFALLFVGYLGRYITTIRFRGFEAELERFHSKVTQTLDTLQEVARSYESIRARMASGGERDTEMDRTLRNAELEGRLGNVSATELTRAFRSNGKGERIWVLGVMRANPDLCDIELVLEAIENPHAGFDQDRFLLLAGEMVPTLTDRNRQRLRDAIQRQRDHGEIRQHRIRWLTSERVLRLLDRYEDSSSEGTLEDRKQ